MNFLDIILIAIIAVNVFFGYRKGLIITIFNVVSVFLAVGLTYLLYPSISRFVMTKTGLYEKITTSISDSFNFGNATADMVSKQEQLGFISQLKMPDGFKQVLTNNNNSEVFGLLNVNNFGDYLSRSLSSIAINILVFVGLFLIIYILLIVLSNALNLVSKLPGLHQMNKMGGGIIGLVYGISLIMIGLTLLSLFMATKENEALTEFINQSLLGKYLYDNNPILGFLNIGSDNNHFWRMLSSVR